MKSEEKKSQYEQQEDALRAQSEAFIGLLTKRGLLGDQKIQNEKIRAAQQKKRKQAYYNTEMLLKHYRLFVWVITCASQDIAEELENQYATVDELLFKLAIGNHKANRHVESGINSRILLKRLDE